MKRIDLDDLPPKLAALLADAQDGEEILLVWNGTVVGRLIGGPSGAPQAPAPQPELTAEERAKEVFEQFRSLMEDEF